MILSSHANAHSAVLSVLVVSGDPCRVDAVRRTLESWPITVTVAGMSNALSALRHALLHTVDLVIVDWAMDGASGQALVRQLARLRPKLPVLVFDAAGPEGPGEHALASPWDELTTVLGRWLLHRTMTNDDSSAEGSVS